MPYKHGAYGYLGDSIVQQTVTSETVPVYVGTAPVGLVSGDAPVNVPVKLESLADAQTKVGYNSDFGDYTLCEAIAAHFDAHNAEGVGPIYVINVLDPEVNRKADPTERTVLLAGGKASVAMPDGIVDTLVVKRPPVDGATVEMKLRDDYEPYVEALKKSGVTLEGGVFSWDGSPIDPSLYNGTQAYVGINFVPPEGATGCKMVIDGTQVVNIASFTDGNQGGNVQGGMPVHYFAFADADGKAFAPRVYDVTIEWTMPDGTESTEVYVGRETLDYIKGTDYDAEYVYQTTGDAMLITSIDGRIPDGQLTVEYVEMDPASVTAADVVGMRTSDGVYSGIASIALMYQDQFVVPNLIAAPGWSDQPDVYNAMVDASQSINGHWNAMVVADIPLVDAESQMVDTIDKAIAWKDANLYDSERAVACWPMATDAEGRSFHVSTLFVAQSQKVDQVNGGIPYESPSNKAVPVVRQYFGANSRNMGFDQQSANTLNADGITTVVGWAGETVLWGPHTAAYAYDDPTVDPRSIFAPSMRMLFHITNSFQQEWGPLIDSPMTRQLRDRIVNREQEKLDGYVTMGALLGEPKVYFLESKNPTSELMEGNFVWDITATPTPPLKSATAYVSYTDDGFSAYFGEGA